MSSYKDDLGRTKFPTVYFPMNEYHPNATDVACRVGMSNMKYFTNAGFGHVIDSFGRLTVPAGTGDAAVSNVMRLRFQNNNTAQRLSMHHTVLGLDTNVGKHIIKYIRFNASLWPTADVFINFIFWDAYATYGQSIEFHRNGGFRMGTNVGASGTAQYASSISAAFEWDKWTHFIWTTEVVSTTRVIQRIYTANADGTIRNGGAPVLTQDITVGGAFTSINGGMGFGFQGGVRLEMRDFLAYNIPVTSAVGTPDATAVVTAEVQKIVDWYKNPANAHEQPDFLRDPKPTPLATTPFWYPPKVHYSYWSLSGSGGETILGQFGFALQWLPQNSSADGMCIGMSINAFQPTAGTYLVDNLRALADWLWSKGWTLKLLINDQTYLGESEVPDHMPHWKKHYLYRTVEGVEDIRTSRSTTYWDNIDSWNLDTEVFGNASWPTYDSTRATNGTYRWFHHVWTLINAVADKPAFVGVTMGETSGSSIGDRDQQEGNTNGQYNTRGIYGITDSSGVYQMDKIYSVRKQRVYFEKVMRMVNYQLRNRPDVLKSVQFNYFRMAIQGNNYSYYDKATRTFTVMSYDPVPVPINTMFKNGDAVFLLGGSSGAIAAGMQYNTLYYAIDVGVGGTGRYKLAATPGGTAIEFAGNITGSAWMIPICSWKEIEDEKTRSSSVINGYTLSADTREFRYLVEDMHEHDFILSGPDIVTSALETPFYSLGAYNPNAVATISPVEFRLMALHGKEVFSDLGPMKTFETQGQDSMYTNLTSTNMNAIIDLYGDRFSGRYSLAQLHKYAIDRLEAAEIVYFVNNEYTEKALPNLINAVCNYKLKPS